MGTFHQTNYTAESRVGLVVGKVILGPSTSVFPFISTPISKGHILFLCHQCDLISANDSVIKKTQKNTK